MISTTVQNNLQKFVPAERIFINEPMKKHTTFQVGGDTDCLITVESTEELRGLIKYLNLIEIPYLVLGNGSNLLVSDDGYRGVVIKTKGSFSDITVDGDLITAQSGALMSQVAKAAYDNGLTGFEFAAGIPGTVGGGVVMNAGAYGGEMSQVVERVEVIDVAGELLVMGNSSMEFGYRKSAIKNHPFVVTEVTFKLQKGDREQIKARMDELASARREKQPLEFPSAGSTFKRPEGYFAGKLIMDSGFRGYTVGGAQVSEKHCGFVINRNNATAKDVSDLMKDVADGVYEKFGVQLEPEVIRIGRF